MSEQRINYPRGVVLCLIATVAWGCMFPIMTVALRHIDPFTFTCMRYAIAGSIFLAVLLAREGRKALRLDGGSLGLAWLFGTLGFAGFQFLVFFGQKLIGGKGALNASIMMATMPMMGFFVTWVLKRSAPPKGALVFIAMSFLGVFLVISKGHAGAVFSNPRTYGPDLLLLFAALCWVVYTAGAGYFPQWSPLKYTTLTTGLGIGTAFVVTAVLLVSGATAVPSGGSVVTILPELAYMSVIAGFVGVLSWNAGNKILTPLNGVLFMDVVPTTAFVVSAIIGVIPSGMQVVGGIISATALVLNNIYLRHRLTAAPAAPRAKAAPLPATELRAVATGDRA
jgi:drug/metabolite transporter (DMT)-like permease